MPEYHRSVTTVSEDYLWPDSGLGGPDPEQSVRHSAIAEVMRRIPSDDYNTLCELADTFHWYIPHLETRAEVMPFSMTHDPDPEPGAALKLAPYAQVLYLSPTLEHAAWDVAVAVVAHELAHVVLGHELRPSFEQYDRQENDVFVRLQMWGFEREARKHRAVNRWRESYEGYLIRKLVKREEAKSRVGKNPPK